MEVPSLSFNEGVSVRMFAILLMLVVVLAWVSPVSPIEQAKDSRYIMSKIGNTLREEGLHDSPRRAITITSSALVRH